MKKIQDFLLYLLFFSLNFEVWDPFETDGNLSIVKLMGVLYVASIMPNLMTMVKIDRLWSKVVIPLFCFFILLTTINLVNLNFQYDTVIFTTFLQWMLIMVIIINHNRLRSYVMTTSLLWFAGGAAVQMLLYNLGVGVDQYAIEETGRATIFGDNQNSVGLRMAVAMTVIVYYTVLKPIKMNMFIRLMLWLMVPGMMFLLIETASRVALASIALMLVMSVLLINGVSFMRRTLLFLVMCGLITAGVIYVMNSPLMMSRIVGSLQWGDLAGRETIWARIWPLIEGNPVFGVGQNGYRQYAHQIGMINSVDGITSPHNVFLEILCYTGIVGLLFYLLFLGRLFLMACKSYEVSGNFLPLLLMVTIAGRMLSGQVFSVKLAWCTYACIIALCVYSSNLKTSDK